jgi:hypothetical protein
MNFSRSKSRIFITFRGMEGILSIIYYVFNYCRMVSLKAVLRVNIYMVYVGCEQ